MNLKYSIVDMIELGKTKGFYCVSDVYRGIQSKLKWRCSKNHEWEATPNGIKNGNGCPICSHSKPRKSVADMHTLAVDQGLEFLSKEYAGMKKKHLWKCKNGHRWYCMPCGIKAGTNCPKCSGNIMEEKIRFIFESLLDSPFPKDRKVLKGLELDGFCDKLMLAFEYNGKQHYSPHFWNKNGELLQGIAARDAKKSVMCDSLGIRKIDIPYSEPNVEQYVRNKLIQLGYSLHKVVWDDFIGQPHKLLELIQTAKDRGGVLISQTYEGSHLKHKWECGKGHQWMATAKDVQNGSWCSKCANNKKYPLSVIRKISLDNGFRLLSDKYQGMNKVHLFQCEACKNKWNTRPNNIQQGRVCPHCKRKEG